MHQYYADLAEQRGHDVRQPCPDCGLPVGDGPDRCRCEDPRCERCWRITDDVYDCETGIVECEDCSAHCDLCITAVEKAKTRRTKLTLAVK